MAVNARSQDKPDMVDKLTGFPTSFFNKINKQSASLEDRLTRQTEKYLQRLAVAGNRRALVLAPFHSVNM